jgi:hypothetical protein
MIAITPWCIVFIDGLWSIAIVSFSSSFKYSSRYKAFNFAYFLKKNYAYEQRCKLLVVKLLPLPGFMHEVETTSAKPISSETKL